jgi:hypothetical protein
MIKPKPLLVVITIVMIATLNCSRDQECNAWFQSSTTGKSLEQSVLLKQIAQTDDIFVLCQMKNEYRRYGGESQVVTEALEEQWKKVVKSKPPPGRLCQEADLIAFDFTEVGPGRYRADFIFRTNEALYKDYWIGLNGIVTKENRRFLSEKRRKLGKKSEKWTFQPNPPTTEWPVGECILISHTIFAFPIPYKMFTCIYDRGVKLGLHGNIVQLGWNSATTEKGLLYLIDISRDFIGLYRLKNENQDWMKRLKIIREAFDNKSRQLLKLKKPLGCICPEADLIAFDYKKVGDNQYRIDYLFQVKQAVDKDYLISLRGVVDDSNLDRLSKKRRETGAKSEVWTFEPDPATSRWPVGEYVLVTKLIRAQPIPYKMYTSIHDIAKKDGPEGKELALGWRVD